jgi:hypothetical protein
MSMGSPQRATDIGCMDEQAELANQAPARSRRSVTERLYGTLVGCASALTGRRNHRVVPVPIALRAFKVPP